jgi:hypothetical protein
MYIRRFKDMKHPWRGKWRNMWDYTTNPNIKTYHSQGALGIKVCRRWLDFEVFVRDIEQLPKPSGCDQLTRIDPAKDYTPSNMKWDTRVNYANRRTDCCFVQIKGKKQSLKRWAQELGMSYYTVINRIGSGMTPKEALLTPVRKVNK